MSRLALFLVIVSSVGCSHQVTVKPVVKVAKKVLEKPRKDEVRPASPNIAVSNDLLDQCMVKIADAGNTPKFNYDQFELLKQDRDVLDTVGKCVMKDGPLAGRAIQLVGRADPRGTEEYNLALGDKRANAVSAYLVRMGVAKDQVSITTRGSLDATGRDENSWRRDRRVDLQLMEEIKVSDAR